MFRFVIAALAVVGLASLFTGGSALGIGALILAPFFFIAKVVFFMMMFGFFARAFGHGGRYTPGRDRAAAFGNWGDTGAIAGLTAGAPVPPTGCNRAEQAAGSRNRMDLLTRRSSTNGTA